MIGYQLNNFLYFATELGNSIQSLVGVTPGANDINKFTPSLGIPI
jgi:hypothetical protein